MRFLREHRPIIRALILDIPAAFCHFTFSFLKFRVWIVWSAGSSVSRLQSRIYRFCAGIVAGFGVIFLLMMIGKTALIRDDGACVIGLRSFA